MSAPRVPVDLANIALDLLGQESITSIEAGSTKPGPLLGQALCYVAP